MSGAELMAWLTAQLDEDEQWATAAGTPVSYGLTDEDPVGVRPPGRIPAGVVAGRW